MNEIYKYNKNSILKYIIFIFIYCSFFKILQVVDIPTTKLSLLIEIIEDTLPAGVKVSIHKHTEEHETLRYIPDNELKTLKSQLDEMGGPKKKK